MGASVPDVTIKNENTEGSETETELPTPPPERVDENKKPENNATLLAGGKYQKVNQKKRDKKSESKNQKTKTKKIVKKAQKDKDDDEVKPQKKTKKLMRNGRQLKRKCDEVRSQTCVVEPEPKRQRISLTRSVTRPKRITTKMKTEPKLTKTRKIPKTIEIRPSSAHPNHHAPRHQTHIQNDTEFGAFTSIGKTEFKQEMELFMASYNAPKVASIHGKNEWPTI